VKIGFKFQSLGKISNISAADPPVLIGQFQHWSLMQAKVYKKRIKDIDELHRARILPDSLGRMDQCTIDAAIRQWRTGLRTCIKAKMRTL